MSATFNPERIEAVATAIADEARAKYHDKKWSGAANFISLVFWTPNINLFRDPRWGRGQETWGEDPELIGRMGAAFVRGLQGNNRDQLKLVACAKHFAVHSGPEALRNGFNVNLSKKLLYETYLPHFKKLVDSGVATVMSAYNAVNGIPCSGHHELLEETLRQKWGFEGFVVSDAGAVSCMHLKKNPQSGGARAEVADQAWAFLADTVKAGHEVTSDGAESAACALKGGCDMAIGSEISDHAQEALDRGLLDEADLDRAVQRILQVLFRVGWLETDDGAPYAPEKESKEILQAPEHIQLAREVARKSMVLLKNNGVLPLQPDTKTIAVSGPVAADAEVLLGNFYRGISGKLTTFIEGLVEGAPEGTTVTYMPGCNLRLPNLFDSTWSYGLAEWSEVAIVALGETPLMEGENGECILTETGGDRDLLGIPEVQMKYVRRMRAKIGERPLVVLLTGGSPIIAPELHKLADAILLAWYPGQEGGHAAADLIYGKASPSGRMPFTVPMHEDDLPPYEDYSMQERTHRYNPPEPLYPFGYGLTYGHVHYKKLHISPEQPTREQTIQATATLTLEGSQPATETIQCYLQDKEDHARGGPSQQLCDFKQITLQPNKPQEVTFSITPAMRQRILEDGSPATGKGTYNLCVAPCADPEKGLELGLSTPLRKQLVLR